MEIARKMMILLQAGTTHGTAASLSEMHHAFGGKTGTTNGFTDAWFLGFSPSVTCGTWVGFDSRQSLGDKETGARAALPIWQRYMAVAVAGKPDEQFSRGNTPKRQLAVAAPAHDDGDSADNDDDAPKPQPVVLPPATADATPDDAGGAPGVSVPQVVPVPLGSAPRPSRPTVPNVVPQPLGVAPRVARPPRTTVPAPQ